MITNSRFCKLFLPIAISSVLVACGGSSSSSSSSGGSSSGGSGGGAAPSNNVGGTASKGIIIGGDVNAYTIAADGSVDRTTFLATPAVTAEDGTYSLTLNSNYVPGTAIFIEISAEGGATMRCDVPQCGTVNGTLVLFGETYPLASTFTMAATLPEADTNSVTVNVTPLTDIASKLTLQKVVSGARPSDAALASNAQIANRLGITGGLINQDIVDITNADAVNGATKDALDYNLKAAAAIAATLKDDPSLSLEDAVDSLSSQFSNGGIADKETAETTAITIEELLEEALAILDAVKAVEGVDPDDQELNSASISITAAKADAEQNGDTTASQGDIPDDIGSEGLVAAKTFVKQVRNLANAGVISAKQGAFAEQINLTSEAVSADSDFLAGVLGRGLYSIVVAYELYQDAPDDNKPSEVVVNGITVAISEEDDTVTLTVDDTVTVAATEVALKLSAAASSAITENETESQEDGTRSVSETGNATAALTVSGSATSTAVSITINEGSFSGALSYNDQTTETETQTASGGSETWDEEFTVTNIDAKLNITLAQLNSDYNVGFTGNMTLKLDKLAETVDGSYSYSYTESTNSDQEQYTETLTLDGFEISLSGEFSDDLGDAVSASLAANIDNFKETCNQESSYSSQNGGSYSYECDLNETETDYAMASLSIVFNLDIDGVDDDVKVEFNASRIGLETGDGTLNLNYRGKQLNLAYKGGNSVTLSNHNGVTMTLTATEDDDEARLSGDIKQGGSAFATISDESGAVVIRYNDGSFETIM
jgi:hypothetical protein